MKFSFLVARCPGENKSLLFWIKQRVDAELGILSSLVYKTLVKSRVADSQVTRTCFHFWVEIFEE